jgi:molecular chaperone DnaK (HSP70)
MMIAIDFGTTNSSVVVLSEGDSEPRLLPIEYGDPESYDPNVLPSAVCDCETYECRDHKRTYGHEALRHAYELQHNTELLQEMKLYFDRSTIDPPMLVETTKVIALREEGGVLNPITMTQRFAYYAGEVPLKPEEFVPGTANLISEVIRRTNASSADRNELVVGFPASFHAVGVRRLREAAKLGAYGKGDHYGRISMYFEPLAAARSYMKIAKGNTLVLDYGGGTLDISVMTVDDPKKLDISKIKFSGFPEAGSRMDGAIVDYCLSKDERIRKWFEAEPLKNKLRFKRAVEKQKISLSTKHEGTIDLPGSGLDPIRITLPEISYALQPILARMVAKVTQTVSDAVGSIQDINFVVMSGGTSLSKAVQTSILAMFRHLPDDSFVLPDATDPQKLKTCLCAVANGLALLRRDGHEPVNIEAMSRT